MRLLLIKRQTRYAMSTAASPGYIKSKASKDNIKQRAEKSTANDIHVPFPFNVKGVAMKYPMPDEPFIFSIAKPRTGIHLPPTQACRLFSPLPR